VTRVVVAALVAVLAVASPAAASEARPTLAEVSHEVMCPTCHTLLELSDAPIAQRMRVFIRRRISAGETKSEIERRLVAQFGPAVLAEPRRHGLGLLAWLAPLALLLAGAVAAARPAIRRAQAAHVPTPLDPALARRLDEELARFDA
jgi:cytochrome c-type biogenesis protein CcmH